MGKNDKKGAGGGKGKGGGSGGADKEAGGKAKGAQSINVRHILVLSDLTASKLLQRGQADIITVREILEEGGGIGKAEGRRQV